MPHSTLQFHTMQFLLHFWKLCFIFLYIHIEICVIYIGIFYSLNCSFNFISHMNVFVIFFPPPLSGTPPALYWSPHIFPHCPFIRWFMRTHAIWRAVQNNWFNVHANHLCRAFYFIDWNYDLLRKAHILFNHYHFLFALFPLSIA